MACLFVMVVCWYLYRFCVCVLLEILILGDVVVSEFGCVLCGDLVRWFDFGIGFSIGFAAC